MKNPLLAPELREMLSAGHLHELVDFCTSTESNIAAEFLGALTPAELQQIMRLLPVTCGAPIFGFFDDDTRANLIDVLEKNEIAQLFTHMEQSLRVKAFGQLPADRRHALRLEWETLRTPEASILLKDLLAAGAALDKPVSDTAVGPAPKPVRKISELVEIFRFQQGRTERVEQFEHGAWVQIVNPPTDSLAQLAGHFNVPLDFLTASLDQDEIARIEVEDNATLIIIKVPFFDESSTDVLYFTIPIGIILVNGYVVTVCSRRGSVLRDFVENKVRHISGGVHLMLQILLRSTYFYLQYLKQLNNTANMIQKKLEQDTRNQQLLKLFSIEKSLVYFTTSLKSNALMLERLGRLNSIALSESDKDLIEDISIESRQALEMGNIYSDILSGMMDAFASVISNNLNIVMKVLASITIIMSIPVLVASIYGMNVQIPLAHHPYAFWLVGFMAMGLCSGAIFFFWKKRWLQS